MKCPLIAALALALSSTLFAADSGILIFQDDFSRQESQEATDEVGNGWTTNSKTRAGGHKQVDLNDGAMHITMHPTADHAVSVAHSAEFRDGVVEMRFMLEDEKDILGVDFADLQLKEVHAGHLFKVTAGVKQVQVDDTKTGGMNMKFYDAKKAKTLTPEQQKLIASKRKYFSNKLDVGQWYSLRIQIVGDTLAVFIDGKEVGAVPSEGFAHLTKRMIRLSVPRQAVVDDVKIFSLAASSASK